MSGKFTLEMKRKSQWKKDLKYKIMLGNIKTKQKQKKAKREEELFI